MATAYIHSIAIFQQRGQQMTDIHAVIAELKALEAKATPGEWILATSCSWRRILTSGGVPVIVPTNSRYDNHPDIMGGIENLELSVASRNALPQLLAYIERLEAVASAAKVVVDEDRGYEDLQESLDALESDE